MRYTITAKTKAEAKPVEVVVDVDSEDPLIVHQSADKFCILKQIDKVTVRSNSTGRVVKKSRL